MRQSGIAGDPQAGGQAGEVPSRRSRARPVHTSRDGIQCGKGARGV